MEVGCLVVWMDKKFKHHRFWEIQSICLGSTKQESLVELKSLLESPGIDTDGTKHVTSWVPEVLLREHKIYKLVD